MLMSRLTRTLRRPIITAAMIVPCFALSPAALAQGALFVENDRVGIGVAAPAWNLHLVGPQSTVRVHVENTAASIQPRRLFQLVNPGAVQFGMTNAASGTSWEFEAGSTFKINRGGSGVNEMTVFPGGNLVIAGQLFQNSDRETKTGIEAIDPRQVLAKVEDLPISTWTRKTGSPTVRHMGPMAQDFAAAFGLGINDRSIAVVDLAGVSLAAIQGLQAELGEKQEQIQQLRQQNDEFAERLARLEAAFVRAAPLDWQ